MTQALLHYITPKTETHVAEIAQISSGKPDKPGLEHAHATFLISTTLATSAEIKEHQQFEFLEYSPKNDVDFPGVVCPKAWAQDKNTALDDDTKTWFKQALIDNTNTAFELYHQARDKGIARECARFLLPMNTQTRFYMTGDLRSWIHYVNLRSQSDTQAEHRIIAEQVKEQLSRYIPTIAAALNWLPQHAGVTLQ